MMRLYLSGPMSGLPSFNIPAFDRLAKDLRSLGHEVVSPAELDDPEFRLLCLKSDGKSIPDGGTSWGDLLARDVKLLADDGIDGIVVLPGWEESRGAVLETLVGRLCGLPIYVLKGKGAGPYTRGLTPVDRGVLECAHAKAAGMGYVPPIDTTNFPPLDTAESVQADAEYHDFPSIRLTGLYGPKGRPSFRKLPAESVQADAEYPRKYVGPVVRELSKDFWNKAVEKEEEGQKEVKDEVEGDLCPKAMIQLAKVCGFGRIKYSRANYLKGYTWSSSYDAMQRHLKAFWAGEEINEESGLHHLAHGSWHALALLAFVIRKIGKDDRV